MTSAPHDPISHIRSHISLSPELEQSLRDQMTECHFKRGERITAMSEIRNHAIYIKRGSARVFYISGGKEHTYSFAFSDQFVTIAHRLLSDSTGNMTIEFLESTDVIVISHKSTREAFMNANASMAEVYLFTLTAMLEHSHALEERIMVLQTSDAPGRYRCVQQKYPHLLERATVTQVASFLGVTKETLYRIRSGKYKN